MELLGSIGPTGLALALTILLLLGTKSGGRGKQLTWPQGAWCGIFAGASYQASTSEPFTSINKLINDLLKLPFTAVPDITMPAVAFTLLIYMWYATLTVRKIGIVAILFFYSAGGAGGGWAIFSTQVSAIMQRMAAG